MRKHITSLAIIHIFIALLILFVHLFCFNLSFYKQQFVKYDVAGEIGISDSELNQSMQVLLDYLQDKRSDMAITVTIDSQRQQMFNDREEQHMVDVKNLYSGAMNVAYSAVVSIGIVIYSFLQDRRKQEDSLTFSLQEGLMIIGLVFGFVVLYAVIDFNGFWTSFHRMFFSNDLWLLDPATDNMILMLPEGLFNALVLRIVVSSLAVVLVFIAILAYRLRRRKYDTHRFI